MIDALLSVVLLVGIAPLAVAIGTLRSFRRSEELGENRYELLRDQQERLGLLREQRQTLWEELGRKSRERRQLIELLERGRPQLVEDLKAEQGNAWKSSRPNVKSRNSRVCSRSCSDYRKNWSGSSERARSSSSRSNNRE